MVLLDAWIINDLIEEKDGSVYIATLSLKHKYSFEVAFMYSTFIC